MYKSFVLVFVVCVVFAEGRPWQFLPEKPGYIPVYIQNGDTPLDEINPDLAEAFHALPAGRSVGKEVEAAPEVAEKQVKYEDLSGPSETVIDRRPYEKQILDKKKKYTGEIASEERR